MLAWDLSKTFNQLLARTTKVKVTSALDGLRPVTTTCNIYVKDQKNP